MKCNMLTDWRIYTDATDKISFIGVSVGSSIQILSRSAWSNMFGLTMFTLASEIAIIKCWSSIVNIRFLESNVSYRWPVSTCELFATFRIWFAVDVNSLIWLCILVFTSIILFYFYIIVYLNWLIVFL